MIACEGDADHMMLVYFGNWPGLGGAVGEFKTGLGPFGSHPSNVHPRREWGPLVLHAPNTLGSILSFIFGLGAYGLERRTLDFRYTTHLPRLWV